MPVRVTKPDGSTVTAQRGFHALDMSGAVQDVPYDMRVALDRVGVDPASLKGGEVVVVADGQVVHRGFDYPRRIEGWNLAPSGAKMDILNYGYTADDSFKVHRWGTTSHGTQSFRTYVDGELVEDGEMRPFQIGWEKHDQASASGFMGMGRMEYNNGGAWL